MKKICKRCGKVYSDDCSFCERCGSLLSEEEKVSFSAEWQGGVPVAPERVEEGKSEMQKIREGAKTFFVLAFVGLLLNFVFGYGAFLCLTVAILASVKSRRLYRLEKKWNAKLVWAMVVGYLGALVGIPFFIVML